MEFPTHRLLTGHSKDLKYINSRPMIAASIVKNDFNQDDDSISPFHQPGLPLGCGSLLYFHWTCVHSTSFPGKQIACHSVVSPRLRVVSMLRYGRTPCSQVRSVTTSSPQKDTSHFKQSSVKHPLADKLGYKQRKDYLLPHPIW